MPSLEEAFDIVRSLPHGHVAAVMGTLGKLGLDRLIDPKPSPRCDQVLAVIAARILEPASKLATARGLAEATAVSTLGVAVTQYVPDVGHPGPLHQARAPLADPSINQSPCQERNRKLADPRGAAPRPSEARQTRKPSNAIGIVVKCRRIRRQVSSDFAHGTTGT